MSFTLATWNINSVRLREGLVRAADARGGAGCAVPAGMQEPGRQDAARGLRSARLRPRRRARAEGLQRRRDPVETAARRHGRQGFRGSRPCPPRCGAAGKRGGDPQFLRARRRRQARPRGEREVRPEARLPHRDARLVPRRTVRESRSWSAISTSPRARTTSGTTSSFSRWSATRRSRSRSSPRCRRPAAGSTSPARISPTAISIPGGPTARRTGTPPTRAGGSTMSGRRPILPTPGMAAGCCARCAAGSSRRTTRRSSRRFDL